MNARADISRPVHDVRLVICREQHFLCPRKPFAGTAYWSGGPPLVSIATGYMGGDDEPDMKDRHTGPLRRDKRALKQDGYRGILAYWGKTGHWGHEGHWGYIGHWGIKRALGQRRALGHERHTGTLGQDGHTGA
jgi:hypothetical protein